jgi:membrane protease YdiL (CAAX protease family)
MVTKVRAILEVGTVFGITLLLIASVIISPIGEWERRVTNRAFLVYTVMIAFPLLLLVVSRRNLASYGISLKNLKYHLDVALTAFVPVAIASVPLMFLDYTRWDGALILALIEIVVLFVLGRLLKNKPTATGNGILIGAVLLIINSSLASKATLGNAISALVFYVFFLGFGEELLFRGYIQSRLNTAFGRPFQFFGVNWGWGIIITSVLFGFMHVLNLGSLAIGEWKLSWWWGFWSFFAGFVFSFVREKTGSIVAPSLLHGLPQAIAYAFLGL